MKIFYLFYFLFFLVTTLPAAEYSCDGEEVTAISTATDIVNTSYTEGVDTPEEARYFWFRPVEDGYVTVREENNKPVSGYYNHKLQIGTSCNGTDIHNGAGKVYDSKTFKVVAGTTYYVKVKEANTQNVLNFNIYFKFDPYAQYECNGEEVEELSIATDTAEKFYTEGEDVKEPARYFWFKPIRDGYVVVKMKNNKPISGYYNHSLKIGTSCDGTNIYNGAAHRIDSDGFQVSSGTTYYVKVQEENSKDVLNFDIDFKFNTDNVMKNYANDYHCSQPHAFELRTNYILPGDLVAIGNSNICADTDYNNICDADQLHRNDRTHIIFINSNSSSQIDNTHNGLDNTSSANLNLPEGAVVQWAGLYWQGEIWDINVLNTDTVNRDGVTIENGITGQGRKALANTIKFKTPNMSSYQELTADEHYNVLLKRKTYGYDYEGIIRYEEHYQSYKDVTELLQNITNDANFHVNGDYWVANIQATTGKLDFPGVEAAWTLQIIYELPEQNPRSLSINDGYVALYSSASQGADYANELNTLYDFNCGTSYQETGVYAQEIDFDVSGFLTPKEPDFATDLSIFLTESDPEDSSTTEYLEITKKDGTISKVDGDNAWNYEITDKNGDDNLNRIPNYIYPIGVTIKNYHQTGILDPEQTSTHITFSTDGDRLLLGVIGFATDLRKPNLCYDYAYSQYGKYFTETYDQNTSPMLKGSVFTGEPIEVKLYIKNTENSDLLAENVSVNILDINTSQVTYIDNSTEVTYPNSITRTAIPDNLLDVANDKSYVKDIPIGDVQGLEYFYTYYQLDPSVSDLNTSITARVDYNITLNAGNQDITIPYQVYLNSDIPICSGSSTYSPAKGIFNIVHNDYYNLDTVHNGPDMSYYNLPTQVSSRVGNFKILSMDPENLDSLKATSTIVAVDMIDASAFHDTNASCAELSSALTKRVWVQIGDEDHNVTSAPFNKTALQEAINKAYTDISTPEEFYKTARQNTAFRVSYNTMDDNGTIPYISKDNNGNFITLNWREEWTGETCNTPMINTLNANIRNKTVTYCNATSAHFNIKECMECIYGLHTRVVCSRDNFAIRPEAFKLHIKDQNQSNPTQQSDITSLSDSGSTGANTPELHLAAGYKYNIEVNATNHINNTSTPGYTRSFNIDNTTTATYKWAPESGRDVSACNAPIDVNTSIRFIDGSADTNTSLNNVGHYTLSLKDTSWTLVDYDPNFMTHHTGSYFLPSSVADCKTNSDLVLNTNATMSPNTSNNDDAILNGCNITSNHHNSELDIQYNDFNVTFHPYKFNLAILPSVDINRNTALTINSTSYIYYADISQVSDENMSYHLDGIIAAQGESGSTLSNFVSQCYAVPLNLEISTLNSRDLNDTNGNHVNYLARFHDLNTSAVVQSALDINATDTTPNNPFVLSTTAAHFLPNLQGNMSTQLNLNYQRTKSVAINPTEIKFISYKTVCSNLSDCTFDANLTSMNTEGIQDLNTTIRHYYGRTHNPRQSFAKTNASVSYTDATDLIYYEVYCDGTGCDKSLLQNGTTSQFSDDPRWLINTNHTAAFGLPGHANQKGYSVGSGYVKETASASGNHPDSFTLRYDGTRGYPYKTTMENDASGWLIYNKYNPAATKNSWDIEFTNASGNWAGVRETNSTTKRNATDLTNRRTLW